MKILITGGLGFIGSNLARHLIGLGHDVLVADNLIRRGSERNLADFEPHFLYCDFRNEEDVALLPGADLIINCHAEMVTTGQKGYQHPELPIRNNGFSTLNVLNWARRHGARVMHVSTNRVYNLEPLERYEQLDRETRIELKDFEGIRRGLFSTDGGEKGIYGISKLVADALVQEYFWAFGVPAVINRIGSITGPGQFGCAEQGWASHFVMSYWKREPITFIGYGGKQVRDLLHVRDLCRLFAAQIENSDFRCEVNDVGGGKTRAISLLEAKAILDRAFGYEVPVLHKPAKKADPPVTFMDNREVTAAYGWTPETTLEAMFTEMVDLAAPLATISS
ncbi:MAG: NAD-dependent epimerase/dehydratase family protein [Armatimonadetes bacterium]|nr:NAD-dependent epimerase/dehydratase family protein [Armatimonadota bacterium]